DRLPPGLQKQVLDHEGVLHYFVRLESTPPVLRDLVLNTLTEGQQQKFVERVNEWQALPAGDRRRIYASFQRFFDLDVKEKQRLLKALPDTEQSEMEKTLVAFQKLSRDERQDCLVSFQKLAAMNATERVKFLHGAERWVALPEEERQTWRALAAYLPPLPGTDLQTKPPLPSPNSTTPVPQLPGTGVPKVEPPAK
ncbi:MAG TPA: DUF3106 domain-containing protein, partial [Verrucomicrobiae bacterium]|nr:DUF3106 domain-containing protein [Verrucomicrobiae bacterium]